MSMDEDDDLLWQTFINSLCDIHPGQAPPPAQSPLPSLPSYLTSDANNTNFETTTASTATATFPAATSSLFEEEIDDPNIDPDYDIIKDLQSIEFEDEDLNLSEYLSFINEPQLLTDPESVASTSAAAAATDHNALAATSSSDTDVSVNKDYFTAEQGKTLQSQLAFHLQALTQTHLLASTNAEHQSLKEGSKQMLDELAKLTESTEKTIQDSRSNGTACTVNLAFEGVPASAALTFLSERGPQIVKAERRNSSKGIEIISEFFRRSILSRRDIFQFDWAFPSKRFLIGEPPLLPQLKCDGEEEGEEGEDGEEGAAEDGAAAEEQKDGKKQLAVAKKTYFSLAEDWLLALAMDEQKRRSTAKRAFRALFDLITELKFLPSKTATSLRLHIKYFRRQLARIEELTEEELAEKRNHALAEIARNPVMHYLKHGRLPPVAGFEDPQRDVYRGLRRPPRWLRRRDKEDDKDELQIVLEPQPPVAAASEHKAPHPNPQQQLRPLQPAIPAAMMMPQMPIEVIYHQPGYTIITLPPTSIDTSSSLQTQLQLQQLQQEQQQLQQLQQQQQQLHQQQLLLPHMTPILPFPSSSSTSSSFVVEATTSVSATSTTTTSVTNSAAMNDVLDLKKQRIEGRKRRSRSVSLKKSSPKATTSEETSDDDPLLPPTKRVRFDDRIEVYVFSSRCSGHESGSSSGSAVLSPPCPGGGDSTDTFEAEGVDGGGDGGDSDDEEGSPSVSSSSSSSSPSSAEEVVEEDEVNALILEGAELPSNCDNQPEKDGNDDQPCNSDNGNQTEISSSSPPDDVPKATIEKVPFPPPPKAADSSPPEPQEEEAEEEEEVAEGEEEEEDDDIIEEFVAPESDDFIIEEEEVEEDAEDGPEMMAMEEELEEEELEEEEVIEEEEAAGELADDYDEHDEHDLHALMMASCTAVSNRARQASLSAADNHHDSTTSSAASSSNQQQLTGPTKITKSRAIALERQSTLYLLRKRASRVEHSAEEEQSRAQFVAYYLKRAQEVLGTEAYVDFLGRLVSLQAQMEVQKKMKSSGQKKNVASADLAAARQLYQGIRGFLTGLKRSCSENADCKIALSEIDELIDMVVLFLSYQQAAAAGEAFRHLHWRRVLDFTRQVELYLGFLYHNKRTQRGAIQRLIKSLRQIGQMKQQKEEEGHENQKLSAINIEAAMKAKMKAVVGRSLNGHTLLLNEFSTLFLDDAPPACLYASLEDFEEFRLDENEDDEEEGGVEIEEVEDEDNHRTKKRPRFERVTVPLGKADQLYGTSECPCRRCHHRVPSNSNDQPPPVTISGDDQPTTSASASASTTSKTDQRITSHCESCSIRFISGRLYVPQYNSSVKKVQLVEHVLREEDQETVAEEAVEGEEETEEEMVVKAPEEAPTSLPSRKWTIEEDRLLLEACQRAIVEWQVTELTAHLFTAVAKKVAGRFVGKEPARSTGELADRLRLLVEMVTTSSSASTSTSTSTSSVSAGST